jgi:hypothetical protein
MITIRWLILLIPILGIGAGFAHGSPILILLLGLTVGAGALALPRLATRARSRWQEERRKDLAYYSQVRKEIGIDPYSASELYRMQLEEDEAQDKSARSLAVWAGEKTYRDASGHLRDVSSDRYL